MHKFYLFFKFCFNIFICLYSVIKMKGKVAIVTASSTGIGKAIATRLAEQGVRVIISSRNQKNVDAAVQELKAKGYDVHGIVCHVGKKEDRDRLIAGTLQKYGQIDFFVPNAASSIRMNNFLEATDSQITKMVDTNYKSTFFLIRDALPEITKQKGSVCIISTFDAYEISSIVAHYSLTKLLLVGMTKILGRELIKTGVRVNCVCPGPIKTDFSKFMWETKEKEEERKNAVGINRWGLPQQMGGAVKFLLSDEASYITGQCVVMAGKPSSRL